MWRRCTLHWGARCRWLQLGSSSCPSPTWSCCAVSAWDGLDECPIWVPNYQQAPCVAGAKWAKRQAPLQQAAHVELLRAPVQQASLPWQGQLARMDDLHSAVQCAGLVRRIGGMH